MANFLPRKMLYIGKAALTALLLWWLFRKLDVATAFDKLWVTPVSALTVAIALIILSTLLVSVRWSIIVATIDSPKSIKKIARYGFISVFFGQVLPSSVGGDGMRIWLLYRAGVSPSASFRSVLIDRAMGFLSLLLLSLYGLPTLVHLRFGFDPTTFFASLMVFTASGIAVLILIRRLAPLLTRARLGRLLVQIVHDLASLASNKRATIGTFVVSIINQLVICAAAWTLIRNLDANASLVNVLAVTPVIFLLLIVPISIGGWGLRESLFVMCFDIVGVSHEAAIVSSILFGIVNVLASLPGGLLWVLDSRKK